MSGEDILYFKIKEGSEIDDDRLHFLMENVVFAEAKKKAIRFLSYSSKTQKEMEDKLKMLQYPDHIIDVVMKTLLEFGYIDDEKYAKKFINDKMRRGYGPKRIQMDLRMKGITRKTTEDAFEQDENNVLEIIVNLMDKKIKDINDFDEKDKQKLYNYLINRGFDYGDIKEAMSVFREENS